MSMFLRSAMTCAAVVFLSACSGVEKGEECTQNGDCEEGQACVDDTCSTVECLGSDACGIENYCTADYTCAPGCAAGSDCLAGSECNVGAHVCEAFACRDTNLDCNFGEFCDSVFGECVPDPVAHCQDCGNASSAGTCGEAGTCLYGRVADACTAGGCPSGQICDSGLCYAAVCIEDCDPDAVDACPRGFACTFLGRGSYGCYADCDYLELNGYSY